MYAFSPLFCKWKVFFRISTYEHVQARSFLKYVILDVPNIHEIQKLERVLQRSVSKKSRREGSPNPPSERFDPERNRISSRDEEETPTWERYRT